MEAWFMIRTATDTTRWQQTGNYLVIHSLFQTMISDISAAPMESFIEGVGKWKAWTSPAGGGRFGDVKTIFLVYRAPYAVRGRP
jgi:hypothetical protein